MIPPSTLHRRRWFQLADGRAQGRSTSIAPIALYSPTMSPLEADRPALSGPLRTAKAAPCADRCRSSASHRQGIVAAGGLKLHSRRSRSARGFVQPGLFAILYLPAAGNA